MASCMGQILEKGGGGGGGGGAQTSAQLKCVWARNVFQRQRANLTLDRIIGMCTPSSYHLCCSVNVTFSGA